MGLGARVRSPSPTQPSPTQPLFAPLIGQGQEKGLSFFAPLEKNLPRSRVTWRELETFHLIHNLALSLSSNAPLNENNYVKIALERRI